MKITSWNVNSVRARIVNIIDYIKLSKPDVLMLQEIKTENKNFPLDDFKKQGYDSYIFGQKSYNGVAFLSKVKLKNINTNLIKDKLKQSRIIEGDIKIKNKLIKLINIYVPNGNPINTEKYTYKLNWLNSFIKKTKKILSTDKNVIIGGDFNVLENKDDAKKIQDWENDALGHILIRKKFREFFSVGFINITRLFHAPGSNFSFWDYQKSSWERNDGLLIDHFLASPSISQKVKCLNYESNFRNQKKPSDHIPIWIKLEN